MLGIAVTEIILDEALVETAVGEREPTGMAQHVGVDRRQPGARCNRTDDVVHRLAGERLARSERKSQGRWSRRVANQRRMAQLVAGHIVVAYDLGKVVIQGKNQEQMETVPEVSASSASTGTNHRSPTRTDLRKRRESPLPLTGYLPALVVSGLRSPRRIVPRRPSSVKCVYQFGPPRCAPSRSRTRPSSFQRQSASPQSAPKPREVSAVEKADLEPARNQS